MIQKWQGCHYSKLQKRLYSAIYFSYNVDLSADFCDNSKTFSNLFHGGVAGVSGIPDALQVNILESELPMDIGSSFLACLKLRDS